MRVCRFLNEGKPAIGFYGEDRIVPVSVAAAEFQKATREQVDLPSADDLLPLLPHGACHSVTKKLHAWTAENGALVPESATLPTDSVDLLVPIPRPNKLLLLAGNYAEHIEEGGGMASERTETFPYVFMKPPTTTLTDPRKPIKIPSVSPDHVDWEIELAVVIGKLAKGIKESEALDYVAGYLVVNDISNRKFHPNPNRKERKKDSFFDWLHGKWHDSFCPCGPCVTAADAIADPQQLDLKLHVNGEIQQDSNTANQIFPVAAVIEFISSFVTLEPGDIISTGTPAGVGNAKGLYLRGGDTIQASIQSIGSLVTRVENE
ncbi:MAG: 5-carboxymethyl-2-hydroxymuconate isomerase [Planctomycetaceae bacterium]|nr:5-carboxymethyl-2-hydroxymuconate isomerase [Planctomycetaceae bacterium]MBP62347.1 5-carboxymethyl-2-hydroxymuconate isomerase [Planctomycetaceae bacterium]